MKNVQIRIAMVFSHIGIIYGNHICKYKMRRARNGTRFPFLSLLMCEYEHQLGDDIMKPIHFNHCLRTMILILSAAVFCLGTLVPNAEARFSGRDPVQPEKKLPAR